VIVSLLYTVSRKLLSVPAVLLRHDSSKDAELLVLRHENAVLRRQISGPVRYEPADRLWFAALSSLIPDPAGAASSRSPQPRSSPGTADLSPPNGTTPPAADRPGALRPAPRSRSSSCNWPRRTPAGATEESTANWPASATASAPPPSGRSCTPPASTRHPADPARPGDNS
jgi:hypothetical protein